MRWVIVIILLHEYNHLNLNKIVWIFYNNCYMQYYILTSGRALCGLYAFVKFILYTNKWKHCESQTLPAKYRNLNNLINFVANLTQSNIILQGSKVVFEHIFVLGLVCLDQFADYLQGFPPVPVVPNFADCQECTVL